MLYIVSYTTQSADDGSMWTDRLIAGADSAEEARQVALDWLDDTSQDSTVAIEVHPA